MDTPEYIFDDRAAEVKENLQTTSFGIELLRTFEAAQSPLQRGPNFFSTNDSIIAAGVRYLRAEKEKTDGNRDELKKSLLKIKNQFLSFLLLLKERNEINETPEDEWAIFVKKLDEAIKNDAKKQSDKANF